MSIVAIIPARLKSSRLPDKPLKDIYGKKMIQRVYEGVKSCEAITRIIVATDSKEISKEVMAFGGEAIITSLAHENGTSRAVEVAQQIDAKYIIIVQGDEPMIYKEALEDLVNAFEKDVRCYSLMQPLSEDIDEEKRAKVIFSRNKYAMTFSRSRIPYNFNDEQPAYYKGVGVYGFEKNLLLEYLNLPMGPIEKAEGIELLRLLENDFKIKMVEINKKIFCVDTLEDLQIVINEYKNGYKNI